MKLLADAHVGDLLDSELEIQVLRSAYSRIKDYNDPLRAPVFALLMRELIRIAMDRISPDEKVKSSEWFHGNEYKYVDAAGNTKVTRKGRYRFAITGTISDAMINKYPELNANDVIKELLDMVDKLSKYAHFTPENLRMRLVETEKLLADVEDVVGQYAKKLIETKISIQKIVFSKVEDSITSHMIDAIPGELDEISSRTRVDGFSVEELQEFDASAKTPSLTGNGTTEVELYYGDRKDHTKSSAYFPTSFKVGIDPLTFDVHVQSLKVDTGEFWGD